jgi:hypothetical protein
VECGEARSAGPEMGRCVLPAIAFIANEESQNGVLKREKGKGYLLIILVIG